MSENVYLALQITLVGMGLVFAAIILLWGLMALLVRVTAEPAAEEAAQDIPQAADPSANKQRAAAIAVAIALAQQADSSAPHEFPLPPTAIVSAWQAVMRTRMLNKRGPTLRGPRQ